MNLDLFADHDEAVSSPETSKPAPGSQVESASRAAPAVAFVPTVHFGRASLQWGEAAVDELAASGDAKTRLKNLKAEEGAYEALVQAVLMVAWRKSTAYLRARTQQPDEAFGLTGWIRKDPELARATELLTRSRLAVNELEMLPDGLHPEFA
jgi:hypothetical protein